MRRARTDYARADIAYRLMSLGGALPDARGTAERVRAHDPRAIDEAIAWLETDPFCLYSGYTKQTLMRALARAKLSTRQADRLRKVVLQVITRGPRQEFRDTRRLAVRLDSREFRDNLSRLRLQADEGTAQRAQWILDAMRAVDR